MRIGETNYYRYTPARQPEQQKQGGRNEPAASADEIAAAASPDDTEGISPKNSRQLLQKLYQDAEGEMDEMRQQLESANAQAEAMGESAKVRMECNIIAMRIMSGDEVPREDHRYLAKHDPELYAKAITMRVAREKPKHYKRISEDEDGENGTGYTVGSKSGGRPVTAGDIPRLAADASSEPSTSTSA